MQFQLARSDVIRAINQRWLLKTWNERRGGRPLPSWLDLSGRDLAGMSQYLCYLDVVRDNGNLRFLMRHHSDWLGEVYGFDCHNQYLDQMQSGPFQDAMIATYRHVEATRSPVYASADITDGGGRLVHYERLLLPFGHDGETVDRILGSLEMISPDGPFEHRNLMVANKPPSSFAVSATIQPT
jgi:hypothetical protein